MLAEWFPNEADEQLGIFIQKHAEAIAKTHPSVLLYARGVKGLSESFVIEKEELNSLKVIRIKFKKSTGILRYRNFFRYKLALQKGFLEANFIPDLVHVHVPGRNSFLALFLKRKYHIPFFVTEHWHGWIKGAYIEDKVKRKWVHKLLSKASGISVVSETLKKAMIKTFPDSTFIEKIKIIPNVVEGEELHNQSNEMKSILTVCDLDDEVKNISGLIDAFTLFSNDFPQWKLDVIGGGKDEAFLKEYADQKCSEKIRFLGRKSNQETLNHFSKYSFFVSNSNHETFGVAIAEALMSGVPVVSSKSGGPESFLNHKNSILYDKGDTEALCKAMMSMALSFAEYDKMELKASVSQFSKSHVGQMFDEWYRKGIAENPNKT